MWSDIVEAAPRVVDGVGITLLYTALGAVAALVVSFVFGLMALSRHVAVRVLSRVVVEFFRGTSLVIQLIWFAYVLPQLGLGFRLDPVGVAAVALAMNFGAYGSEIVRGAINAVPVAQWEATTALSMSPWQRMRRVILPQAWPEMVPPFANLLVQMLKSSSLLFLVGIVELAQVLRRLHSDVGGLVAYGAIGLVVYFVIAQLLVALMRLVESRAAARVGRGRRFEKRPAAVGGVPSQGAL